ncbi:lipoxygenase [Cystobacter fuscus]|uniref:lipoxygenase family protein n=1 Tax=Cystobacter fuscus TaxID=43 RepID=UPI002B2A91B1|nr:lipoxygenase [Cystobacter fuscus]
MSTPIIPSLPQNDSPFQQQQRRSALAQQQQLYTYNFHSRLQPLGIAAQVPQGDGHTFAWIDGIATTALQLLGNYLSIAAKHFNNGEALPNEHSVSWSEREFRKVEGLYKDLTDGVRELSERVAQLHQVSREPAPAPVVGVTARSSLLRRAGHLVEEVTEEVIEVTEVVMNTEANLLAALDAHSLAKDIRTRVDALLQKLLSEAGDWFARFLGLFGEAPSLAAFTTPFSLLLLPSVASNYDTDLLFARMRLAGPNPLVIQRIEAPDPRFPVTDAQYRAAMGGADDSLSRAGAEGRLYLADYAVFDGLATGTTSGGQKYIEAPLALFAVPPADAADRRLRPVAIQLSQKAGAPIFTPGDGTSWLLARLHVQVADGNHHELISHLGLTHLVLEEFAMATPRQLSTQHPLYLLLTPHFQGTLSINDGAESTLIAPGGPVDLLLSGEIGASTRVCVQAVAGHRINQAFLPRALAFRGVDDPTKLPDYPYRDDALLLWNDIHAWVGDYLSLYYEDDAAVRADYELQNWVQELGNPSVGKLQDIGEQGGGIQTRAYLVDLVTYVIFTASAQHATVNFPQRTIMSFTPAMPLAAYAPAPTRVEPLLPASTQLAHLPPLQMALLQQVVGFGLGNIYFTRLGAYDAYLHEPWFQDPRVSSLLGVFQERLRTTEREIGQRNLSRIPYDTLLPSSIPQSINI